MTDFPWLPWYVASVAAGRPLETRAEVVYFARDAFDGLLQNESPVERLLRHLVGSELPASDGRVQNERRGERLPAYQLVDLLLKGAALALLITHSPTLSRLARAVKAATNYEFAGGAS